MTNCYFCKKELPQGKNYCVHCDHETNTTNPFEKTTIYKKRSVAWFLLPIFLGIIGGVIAFLIIRKDDPMKGAYCLIIGAVSMVVGIILNLTIPELMRDIPSMINI